ncbi:MAG TPA: hypothetical protein VFJ30_14445, partial [Phycisphaerae bacterium]|nr:hypothetical protein [Phycisphaerae bacterium]
MRHTTWCAAAAVLLAASAAGAEVVIEQWSVDGLSAHPKSIRITPAGEDGPGRIEIELGLGKGTKIHRASLLVERELITGAGDDALVDAKVYPAGRTGRTTPLKLEAPWFNSLDVTEAVAAWANSPSSAGSLVVEALPGWQPD